jgi:hypothetical protein
VNLPSGVARSRHQAAMAAGVLGIVLDDSPRKTTRRTSCTLIILSERDICLTACGRKSSFFQAAALTRDAISHIDKGGGRPRSNHSISTLRPATRSDDSATVHGIMNRKASPHHAPENRS